MSDPRTRARGLSTDALARGDAVGWFEHLYREAVTGGAIVPWADLRPNPHLVDWLGQGARLWSNALVVGCGFGDDAECLADYGAGRVTAFDVSSTAIAETRRRFPESRVDYLVADAFDPPAAWRGSFDLIVEISTLQVLPPELREPLVRRLVDWVAPGGTLLVVSRGRDEGDPVGELPWPLTRAEVELPVTFGLSLQAFDDVMDDETPPVRRLIGTFVRSGTPPDGVGADRGVVVGVSRRAGHGVGKDAVGSITLVAGHGVEGDAHFGVTVQHRSRVAVDPTQPNLRQVHLVHAELFDELAALGFAIEPGQMGENITTRGVPLLDLPRGSLLRVGTDVVIEVTGLRNPCVQLDGLHRGLMSATLDRAADGTLLRKAGIMGIVTTGGHVRPGDAITVDLPQLPHVALDRV